MSTIGTNKFISGFNQGLDRDTAISRYGNETYFDATDMRLISRGTLSNGALVNVKGNQSRYSISKPNEEVIASCQIKDDIILFSRYGISNDMSYTSLSNNTTLQISFGVFGVNQYNIRIVDVLPGSPDPQYDGYILTSYSPTDIAIYLNTISGLSDSILFVPNYRQSPANSITLFYKNSGYFASPINITGTNFTSAPVSSGSKISKITHSDNFQSISNAFILCDDQLWQDTEKLNFDKCDFLSVVGRFESDDIQKIYWANGIDPLRYANIANQSIENMVDSIDHIPYVNFSPIAVSISEGGNLKAGVIQYSYQYFNKYGAASAFSPPSDIVKLADNMNKNIGSNLNDTINKSVLISIDNVDTSFDYIRVVSIFYNTYESDPVIKIVAESGIGSSTTVSVIDSGSSIGDISLAEYRTFAQTTLSPSIISSKNNYLFIANVAESTFDSDAINLWDSRAYAFDGYHGYAKIYNSSLDDGINDYYLISYDGSFTFHPGVGAPTPGVSWQIPEEFNCVNRSNNIFSSTELYPTYCYNPLVNPATAGAEVVRLLVPYLNVDNVYGGLGPNVNYQFEWFSRIHSRGKESDSYQNSIFTKSELLTECYPGEIYRVGIKFFNQKGQSSFAKWIGDIRIPDVGNKVIGSNSYTPLLTINVVNFPNDPSIVGYQIVRVKVEQSDISIKATGLVSPLTKRIPADNYYTPYISNVSEVDNPMLTIDLIQYSQVALNINPSVLEVFSPDLRVNNPSLKYLTNSKLRLRSISYGNVWVTHETPLAARSNIDSGVDLSDVTNLLEYTQFADSTTMDYLIEDYIIPKLSPNDSAIALIQDRVGGVKVYNQFAVTNLNNDYLIRASRSTFPIIQIDNGLDLGFSGSSTDKFLIASIISNVDVSRYGGATVQNRFVNTYIPFSRVIDISNHYASCVYGDSYKNEFYFMRSYYYVNESLSLTDNKSVRQYCKIIVPSRIDCRYTNDDYKNYIYYSKLQETTTEGLRLYPTTYDSSIPNLYVYNNVYSQVGDSSISIVKPENFINLGRITNKIISSEKKSNGENIDSWTNFLSTNFIEVDGQYGELLGMNTFNSTTFFFQEDAVGTLAINDRSVIQDNNSGPLTLGTGGVLDRFDYITVSSGPKDSYSILQTKNDLYYIDGVEKRIYSTIKNSTAISEIKGIHSLLNDIINSDSKIRCGYDYDNKEALFSIDDITLCYNENIDSFVSRYNFIPDIYITTLKGLYSSKMDYDYYNNSFVYKHNEGDYGEWYVRTGNNSKSISSVTLLIVPTNGTVNYFDSVELKTEVYYSGENIPDYHDVLEESATRLKFSNSYINEIDVESNSTNMDYSKLRRFLRSWRMQVPLTQNSNRFVDSYLMLTIEFDNNNNKMFKLRDVTTNFRQSK